MNYEPRISKLAEGRLGAQPEPLRSFIVNSLERLAETPVSLSKTAKGLTVGQVAEFKFEQVGVAVWVTVTFLYGQDEQTLYIEDIAVEFGA